ncbi:MAG: hypothetical protein OXM02_13545 [Bacteroidota bacterium]|nr:hypothetical protein [Bacteroidota bacterium]
MNNSLSGLGRWGKGKNPSARDVHFCALATLWIVTCVGLSSANAQNQQNYFARGLWYVGASFGTDLDAKANYKEVLPQSSGASDDNSVLTEGSRWSYYANVPAGRMWSGHVGRHLAWLRLELSAEDKKLSYEQKAVTFNWNADRSQLFKIETNVGSHGSVRSTSVILGISAFKVVEHTQAVVGIGVGHMRAKATNPLYDDANHCLPGHVCERNVIVRPRTTEHTYSDTSMLFQITAGVNYHIGHNIVMGLGGNYRWLGGIAGEVVYEQRTDIDVARAVITGAKSIAGEVRLAYLFNL